MPFHKLAGMLAICVALAQAQNIPQNPAYVLGPDSQPKPGVPRGKVSKFTFDKSKVFPGTTRAVSVYVPAQYDGSKPACLMIFSDGSGYANETGGSRVPVVFDNLIAEKSMPVTIAIFVDPGVTAGLTADQMARYHRSLEYDGLGDKHARLLIDEIIPEVEKQYNVKISANPDDRGLLGGSSGGIASFVAAWERPDSFHRVGSFIGSFAGLRGGDTIADMIRKVEPKPLRIFMQDGANDQNIYGGSWVLANQEIFSALEYSGYDVKFVVGTEGHSGRQGSSMLPDVMRWLWRDYPAPIVASKGGPGLRHYITDFLDPESGWQVVGKGYGAVRGLAVDKDGAVYFAGAKAGTIFKTAADGAPTLFKSGISSEGGMMGGPDGRLYVAEPAKHRIVSLGPDGAEKVVAMGVHANDIAVTSKGRIYFTDRDGKSVWLIDTDGKKREVFRAGATDNVVSLSGLRVSPDEHLLDVADKGTRWVRSFEIGPDNGLRYGMEFHHLESPDESSATGAGGMTIDDTGHLYVTTRLGIQICDQPGRVVGIISNPQAGEVSSVVFGGPGLHTLYVAAGDKIFARKMRRTGVYPWVVVKLPRPQL
jgi:gluconolactonase